MGAEIDARFDTDGDIEPRKVTMYELIERGNILTDESIKDIICVKNPDGTRTVSVKKEIGNEWDSERKRNQRKLQWNIYHFTKTKRNIVSSTVG